MPLMFYEEPRFKTWIIFTFLMGILTIGVSGCNQQVFSETLTPAPTLGGDLHPYLTATTSPTPESGNPNQESSPIPTEIPLPTSTPFIYAVVAGDTLTGIAFRYSIPLEELIAANPGLDPNFLTIGLTLTIPIEGVSAEILPTPTPIPIRVQNPDCYLLVSEDLHCLVMVENNQTYPVENVIVQVTLQSTGGENLGTKTAIPPLNLLPAGRSAAVSVLFENIGSQDFISQASPLTVIPVAADSQRYLETEIQIQESLISLDGLQAQVRGSITLPEGQPDAKTVWVAAFAYDENENIVGLRKWVASDVLVSGDRIDFDLTVYSFGPPVMRLELLSEARP